VSVGMSLVFNEASRLEEIASVYAVLVTLKSVKFSSKISSKLSAYNGPGAVCCASRRCLKPSQCFPDLLWQGRNQLD
jgi:hypothetical protein